MVREYLKGSLSRLSLELDLNHEMMKRYEEMYAENSFLAEAFNYYLCEKGVDIACDLSDRDFRKLMEKQFHELESMMHDGVY